MSTILGFLWINEEELGFDPTIMTANGDDLTLTIKEQREGASGARGKTGTRAFMAIGGFWASRIPSCTISSHFFGSCSGYAFTTTGRDMHAYEMHAR
jgi:hypothetical protein